MAWYTIKHVTEEGQCQECGYPMYQGERAFESLDGMYCGPTCAKFALDRAKHELTHVTDQLDRRLAELKGGQT